ncbi:MAG: hypothetical protein ACYC8T_14410 [Myxococcaceae bacterium]
MLRSVVGLSLAAFIASPAQAGERPSCFAGEAVPEMPDKPHNWLSKDSAADIRKHFEKLTGSNRWEKGTLIMPCAVQGEAHDRPAVTVEGAGEDPPPPGGLLPTFTVLAQNSGHTLKEAEALAKKYEQLRGSFYRYVPDERGQYVSESQLIHERHKKRLGIVEPELTKVPADDRAAKKERAKALKVKIKAAKERGDIEEMMRLAGEAQNMSAPGVAMAKEVTATANKQGWALMESVYPDLMSARYRTRVVLGQCPCLTCKEN